MRDRPTCSIKNMSDHEYFIRPVRPEDSPSLIQLIYELAVYEKAPRLAVATPELITKHIFETRTANALLVFSGSLKDPGEAIAFALYFFNFSTWTGRPGLYLEDLYVKPEHRNKGIGKALFKELAIIAQDRDCARMDWSVLKWNQPSIDFYEKCLHAKTQDEWVSMRLEEEGIENLKNINTKKE
ncbi:acyl-CoA N-acyltransferase [Multifurca ochricompacta]|uniref:Acyl-CoA N-acyltransferase n=1 Tax=Multifurca ochricompacta TaxID=376703 RepID=A0AAD4M2A3_9AGAM|nr:acyl-CoA N-acyltransferase [Multifurca ochricompacta]